MKNRVIAANHLKQEISASKPIFQQGKSALSFSLLFVANEVQLMKANIQSVVESFVQNARNALYQIDVIHLLICDKDRIFFLSWKIFLTQNLLPVSSFSTFSSITNKARAHIFFFLNESAAIMSISFDFGAIIIFLFGLNIDGTFYFLGSLCLKA